jgi:hypothetical protein
MNKREFIVEVLETLRDMEDAINVICELDADAVLEQMESEEEE